MSRRASRSSTGQSSSAKSRANPPPIVAVEEPKSDEEKSDSGVTPPRSRRQSTGDAASSSENQSTPKKQTILQDITARALIEGISRDELFARLLKADEVERTSSKASSDAANSSASAGSSLGGLGDRPLATDRVPLYDQKNELKLSQKAIRHIMRHLSHPNGISLDKFYGHLGNHGRVLKFRCVNFLTSPEVVASVA